MPEKFHELVTGPYFAVGAVSGLHLRLRLPCDHLSLPLGPTVEITERDLGSGKTLSVFLLTQ